MSEFLKCFTERNISVKRDIKIGKLSSLFQFRDSVRNLLLCEPLNPLIPIFLEFPNIQVKMVIKYLHLTNIRRFIVAVRLRLEILNI